jgi:hypothetical protein
MGVVGMAPLEIWLELNLLNLLAKLKREKYISHFLKSCEAMHYVNSFRVAKQRIRAMLI